MSNLSIREYSRPPGPAGFPGGPGLTPLSEDEWTRLCPDRHFVAFVAGVPVARASVWRSGLPPLDGVRPAAIGHFAAVDAISGADLLKGICSWLEARGSRLQVGPLDANTWNRYRLVSERGDRPPFFLEPWHPPHDLDCWTGAGFVPLAEYHSGALRPQTEADPRLGKARQRMESAGLRLRCLRLEDYERELRRIYAVSRISFAGNLLYTPIAEDAFVSMYAPLRDKLRPDLVWLAECGDICAGFLFAFPDYNQAARGEKMNTLVIKTLAILPDRAFAGLGQWLTRQAHESARAAGFTEVIHGLMHSGSRIKHFGRSGMSIFRRYQLFHRRS